MTVRYLADFMDEGRLVSGPHPLVFPGATDYELDRDASRHGFSLVASYGAGALELWCYHAASGSFELNDTDHMGWSYLVRVHVGDLCEEVFTSTMAEALDCVSRWMSIAIASELEELTRQTKNLRARNPVAIW